MELGIPYELWDEPSAEVSALQRECSIMLNEYEETIEDWYFNNQAENLLDYFCRDHVFHSRDGHVNMQASKLLRRFITFKYNSYDSRLESISFPSCFPDCLSEVWTGAETVDDKNDNSKSKQEL